MEDNTQTSPVALQTDDAGFRQKRRLIGLLSYINILVIPAYMLAKGDERLLFHVRQGAVLFSIEMATICSIVIMPFLLGIFIPLQIIFFVYSVIGVYNATQGHERPLPFIGSLASHVPF